MSTFLQKIHLTQKYTFALESFDSVAAFFFGFALFVCEGVGGAGFCWGDEVARPLAAAPAAGTDGGGILRC